MADRGDLNPAPPALGVRVGVSFAWSGAYLLVSRLSAVAAVPLVLHNLGSALYAAWVVAGSLILVQSLVDLGFSGALLRFAARGAAEQSRHAVTVAVRRSLAIYGGLSVAIGLPMWLWARELADLLPYLQGDALADGAVIVRYAAVAFALTNLTLVLASFLQAAGRVDSSYRAQTLGWIPYVPLLYIAFELDAGVDALGIAWVGSFACQLALLGWHTARTMPGIGDEDAEAASWREMLGLGTRLQVSSWADFATFQLPRLIGGVALTSGQLINLDLALRIAQLVVDPILAFFPVVLPAVARVSAARGPAGIARLLERWATPGLIACLLGTAALIPLEAPAVAVWTGRALSSFDPWLGGMVLVGLVAHASTGLFSSALLAIGEVRPILVYKTAQLLGATLLMVPGAFLGPRALAAGLGVALLVPALVFDVRSGRRLGVSMPPASATLWRRVAGGVLVAFAVPLVLTLSLRDAMPSLGVLAVAVPVTLACCAGAWLWCTRGLAGGDSPVVGETQGATG